MPEVPEVPEDLAATLERLMRSGAVESATVTVVLKPRPPSPPPDVDLPACVIDFGPVSTKR
jgi:hypothetical protein